MASDEGEFQQLTLLDFLELTRPWGWVVLRMADRKGTAGCLLFLKLSPSASMSIRTGVRL
jgi:hypothetical protein